jgi:hypothetical protein
VIRKLSAIAAGAAGAIVVFCILKWALAEYYIATHCTMVLGTRVCR